MNEDSIGDVLKELDKLKWYKLLALNIFEE